MPPSRREFLQTTAFAAVGLSLRKFPQLARPAVRFDDFQPTWASLAQFRTPEWFRDAKFGMWAERRRGEYVYTFEIPVVD